MLERGGQLAFHVNAQTSSIFEDDYILKISQTRYDPCPSLYIPGDLWPFSHLKKKSQWIQFCHGIKKREDNCDF